jgi:ATP-dependent Lon protease
MPHKHCTRTKTNSIQKVNYVYDSSNSSTTSGSDYEYSENSSDCSSDYSSENGSYDDYGHINDRDDHDVSFNKRDYYKFLSELYPSNYSKNKYNALAYDTKNHEDEHKQTHKRAKKVHTTNFDTLTSSINKHNLFNSKIIKKKRSAVSKKNYMKKLDDESDSNDEDDEEDDDDDTKYEKGLLSDGFKTLLDNVNKSDKSINIIVNLKNGENKIYNNNNNNNESRNSNQSYIVIDEEDEHYEEEDDEEEEKIKAQSKNKFKKNNSENMENSEIIHKDDVIPAPQKISNKNYRLFDKILHAEEKESEYFKTCLSKNSQLEAIAKLEKLKEITKVSKPYLLHLVDLDIPDQYKACALRKINTMRSMCGHGNSEYFKIKSWVDSFLKIPFNKYNNLPISFADGIDQCHDFMENAKKILDSVTYGLEDAKIQIMQMIGLWLVNPNAIGCAIAIKGPPGTGKTTLIKEGISKILNRPFALIALGGCGDSGFIDGFDYTYEGSKHGKIVDILIQCGCMNPIILFDELDKLSDSFKGQEITGVLTHLTDSTQNTKFSDKYFSEISIDMSKALFIFSYNDEAAVNPILKDRMYKIETKGYKTKDKLIIAKNYLLPKIRDEIKFDNDAIIFSDELLEYIINDFTEKEDGVRNLKRCLEIVYKKLNLYRLMKPNVNLFENSDGFKLKTKISFPCILTRHLIDELINKASSKDIPYGLYT